MQNIKKYWTLLLVGLILRLVIAGITFHPDVRAPALASAVFLRLGSLNPYSDSARLLPTEALDDLPLSYFTALPFHLLGRVWVDPQVEQTFFQAPWKILGSFQLMVFLVYAKLPMIFFDLAVGIILANVIIGYQKKILTLWMFNPITLWTTAAIGQIDIYPTFFIVLSLLLVKKGMLNWAALALGAGGAIKSAPLLLVPLLVGLAFNNKDRIKLLVLTVIPYLVSVLPYLGSAQFRTNALFAPQLSKSFYAMIPLSGGEFIFIVPTALIFLYLLYFSKKRAVEDFIVYSISILLITLSLTHFHIQWFLWVTPLLLIYLVKNFSPALRLAFWGMSVGLLMMLFLFDSSLQLKLFAPLIPSLNQAKGLAEILSNSQVTFLRSMSASIFASSAIFMIWKMLKNQYAKEQDCLISNKGCQRKFRKQ